jgi:predicted DCC family thiol-disulfide oxidoreductase YuxK
MSGEQPDNKIKAYYDGQCPMCSAVMDSVRNSTKADAFDLRDMHKEKRLPFGKQALEKEIHLVDRGGRTYKGAEAIFKIAEEYPHLHVLTSLARTPLIKSTAPIFYGFVAANRRFLFGPASRLFWLKIALVLAFCLGLILSSRLWVGPRSYPAVPVASVLPQIDGLLADGLFAALFLLAAAILVVPKPQRFIAAFLAIIGAFCALDQTRWQPWVFLYGFLLATLALFSWDSADSRGQRSALNIARLILACTYIFAGLQKINSNFMDIDFLWIVQPITNVLPSTAGLLHALGKIVPFVQIAFGIGLLTNRLRRVSLIAAVAMHGFILAMFGPLGAAWNNVVWPWTAAMALFDILLFTDKGRISFSELLWTPRRPYHAVVLIFFAVLPVLSFFNLWDSFLSAALYSGNLTEAEIYVTDGGRAALPASIGGRLVQTSANTNILNLQRWAIEDLNVTPYPETRLYKAITRHVCSELPDRSQLVLIVREQRMFLSKPETGYRCWEL